MADEEPTKRPYVWLSELLLDPDLLNPPEPIAKGLVWANRITLLAAREKTGKSTVAGAAAAAISAGKPFLGQPTVASNVLIISLEEHASEFATRFVKFGAVAERIAIISNRTGQDLLNAIWEAADEIKPSLIVWDTLGAFANAISGKTLDSGDAQGWTRVMMEILEVSRACGASLVLHHANKKDGKYRDSTAIGAAVDVILHMHGEDNEPRTLKAQGRFEIPEIRIALEPDGFRLVESASDLQERVRAFIGTHPRCSMRDIIEGVGGRSSDVVKAKDTLLKMRVIANAGGHVHAYVLVG